MVYFQSFVMVRFLIDQKGETYLSRILRALSGGEVDASDAFVFAHGLDVGALEKAWNAYVRRDFGHLAEQPEDPTEKIEHWLDTVGDRR